jgi:hypothetical protein
MNIRRKQKNQYEIKRHMVKAHYPRGPFNTRNYCKWWRTKTLEWTSTKMKLKALSVAQAFNTKARANTPFHKLPDKQWGMPARIM